MLNEKLKEVYYQPDQLWTCSKAVRKLYEITFIPENDAKSRLAKQAYWQVHIRPPKEIKHPCYKVTKTNEQHQLDLLYVSCNVLKGSTYKYILTGVDVAARHKVAKALRTTKATEVASVLEAIYKNHGKLKYSLLFQYVNGFEFQKSNVTK